MRDTPTQPRLDELANEHRDAFTDALAEMLDSGFGDLEERLVEHPAEVARGHRAEFSESDGKSPRERG